MIYHAQCVDSFGGLSPLKRGDWARVTDVQNGDLFLERFSAAQIVRQAMNKIEDLDTAPAITPTS